MIILFPIGMLMVPITIGFFSMYLFCKSVQMFLKNRYIAGSMLLCGGWVVLVFLLTTFFDATEKGIHNGDFITLYYFVIGFGVFAQIVRFFRQQTVQRRFVQSFPPPSAVPETTGNIIPFVKATREERERVMVIQRHRCANPYCNVDLRGSTPHWDHIVPRSRGGTDSVHNMQWLCETCNLNKRDKHWLEFLFYHAMALGMDPNQNQEPWKRWVTNRVKNGLMCG